MKPSHPADPHSAPTRYAPSVPMSVYRELASELRDSKSVIDSLNSRNQQLLQQNQFLKQEIHNVVQSALSLGQAAGVARPAAHLLGQDAGQMGGLQIGGLPHSGQGGFSQAIAPDTLARLAQAEANAAPIERAYERRVEHPPEPSSMPPLAEPGRYANPASEPAQNRTPRPIAPAAQKSTPKTSDKAPHQKSASPKVAKSKSGKSKSDSAAHQKTMAARQPSTQTVGRRTEPVAAKPFTAQSNPKRFTEQSGTFRSSALDAQENKEISGIWLVLSIILIVVTAFGAGFLIMKPLLNDR